MKSELIVGDLIEKVPLSLIWEAVKDLKQDDVFAFCLLLLLIIAFLLIFSVTFPIGEKNGNHDGPD